MTYVTKRGQRIVCADYHAFMEIARKYFADVKLTEWRVS